jgi:hypothetical protein
MGIRPKDAFKNSSNDHTIYSKVRRNGRPSPPEKGQTGPQCFWDMQNENALCEARGPTLSEMRKLNKVIRGIKILTNLSHPIRHFFCDTKIHDEYVLETNTPKPIFTRTHPQPSPMEREYERDIGFYFF